MLPNQSSPINGDCSEHCADPFASLAETEEAVEVSLVLDQKPDEDDLTRIKGITSEVVKALKRIGIDSFDHLASYTAERLNKILKAQEPPISLSTLKLDTILDQARKLAQPQAMIKPSKPSTAASPTLQKKRQFDMHWKAEEWAELADFFVSFGYQITRTGEKQLQIRAIHYENETEKQLDKMAPIELLEWILIQARPSLPPDVQAEVVRSMLPPAPPPPVADEDSPALELSVQAVSEVGIPPQIEGQGPSSAVRVESWLELPASARGMTHDQTPFSVEAYLVNLQTQEPMLVASHPAQLRPGAMAYQIKHDFPMPEAGRYQLYLAAQLLSPGEATAHVQGPIIRVEA